MTLCKVDLCERSAEADGFCDAHHPGPATPCLECGGATIEFRGNGKDLSYKICSRYRESGHKTKEEVEAIYRRERGLAWPTSGRFA